MPDPIPGRIPAYIEGAILRCMEMDPAKRFGSIVELRLALTNRPMLDRAGGWRGVLAATLVIAVLAGVFLWKSTAAGLPAAASTFLFPPDTRATVAAFPFIGVEGDPQFASLAKGMADMMTKALERGGNFRIVERPQLDRSVMELLLGENPLADHENSPRVGRVVGAEYLLVGSLMVYRNHIRMHAKLVKTETTKMLGSEYIDGDVSEAVALADQLAARVAKLKP